MRKHVFGNESAAHTPHGGPVLDTVVFGGEDAKARVLGIHPTAYAHKLRPIAGGKPWWIISLPTVDGIADCLSAESRTVQEAWDDAASRLPIAPTPAASPAVLDTVVHAETDCDCIHIRFCMKQQGTLAKGFTCRKEKIASTPAAPPVEPAEKYLDWASAGGPNECKHGYAAGIACPRCDEESELTPKLGTCADHPTELYPQEDQRDMSEKNGEPKTYWLVELDSLTFRFTKGGTQIITCEINDPLAIKEKTREDAEKWSATLLERSPWMKDRIKIVEHITIQPVSADPPNCDMWSVPKGEGEQIQIHLAELLEEEMKERGLTIDDLVMQMGPHFTEKERGICKLSWDMFFAVRTVYIVLGVMANQLADAFDVPATFFISFHESWRKSEKARLKASSPSPIAPESSPKGEAEELGDDICGYCEGLDKGASVCYCTYPIQPSTPSPIAGAEQIDWRKKYDEMEEAQSRSIDRAGELMKIIKDREADRSREQDLKNYFRSRAAGAEQINQELLDAILLVREESANTGDASRETWTKLNTAIAHADEWRRTNGE